MGSFSKLRLQQNSSVSPYPKCRWRMTHLLKVLVFSMVPCVLNAPQLSPQLLPVSQDLRPLTLPIQILPIQMVTLTLTNLIPSLLALPPTILGVMTTDRRLRGMTGFMRFSQILTSAVKILPYLVLARGKGTLITSVTVLVSFMTGFQRRVPICLGSLPRTAMTTIKLRRFAMASLLARCLISGTSLMRLGVAQMSGLSNSEMRASFSQVCR